MAETRLDPTAKCAAKCPKKTATRDDSLVPIPSAAKAKAKAKAAAARAADAVEKPDRTALVA